MGRNRDGRWAAAGRDDRPVATIEDGRTVLRVGGVIQSVLVDERYEPDIWDAMLPAVRPASALVLGLGGGTIATLLTRRCGPLPIVGVERDARVAALARGIFGLDGLPNIQVVVADAFAFLPRCQVQFDLVCVDLYVAGHLEHGVLSAAFLREVARVLTPDGVAAFNLWSSPYLADQVRRLQRELAVHDIAEVGRNIVVRCGRRPLVKVL